MENEKVSLKAAIATVAVNANTYSSQLPLDHCYGPTAHGGVLVSIILAAVQQHFRTTLQRYNQPDTFDFHGVFLRPTTAGQVTLEIEALRLGSITSTTRITLRQNGTDRVTALASNMNMHNANGFSASTGYNLAPPPVAAQLTSLADNTDRDWISWTFPWHPLSLLKPITHFRFFSPVDGGPHPSITDIWLTPRCTSDVFTTDMLGSVADIWHRMVENYHPGAQFSTKNLVARGMQAEQDFNIATDHGRIPMPYGYPTLSMSLEIKQVLPPSGVKWLFVRAQAKEIKNGRMDAEVTILNESLELVALSHQVSFIVDTTKRAGESSKAESGRL